MRCIEDFTSTVASIPAQLNKQLTGNRARILSSVLTMNILWALWGIFIERFMVGMAWKAVVDLRISALLCNTVFAVIWTGHIEYGLSQRWQVLCSAPRLWPRWYMVTLGISLLSQVPVQVAAYVPPMVWGDAVWSEVQWSWMLALLFSPIVGVYFASLQDRLEALLDFVPGLGHAVEIRRANNAR
jgi:hypothetical protein